MNWLLICVIGILVVCALEGYFRGFIKIVFSLLAMIITLAVVSVAAPKITTYIEENTELDERITEKCLEHVEKNAQDRLDREAQEKSEETRQQLEENGISGGELDALMDKAAEAGSDAVHQALADSGVYQVMAQKITHFIISLIACIVTYVVVYLVLHIILNVLDLVVKLPVLKGINRFMGMLAGGVKGFLIVWVAFYLIHIMAATEWGTRLVTYIGENEFLAFLYQHNLLVQIFAGIF